MKVQDGTYWHVLIRSVQSGYAFPLNLLLQFCPADCSVLEISASIHTSASASKIHSTAGLAGLACLAAFPRRLGGGGGGRSRFFRCRRCRCGGWALDGFGRGRDGGISCVVVCAGLAGGRVDVHWSSPRGKLADQGLGHGFSSSTGFLEDDLVESSQRVAELCTKFVSGHGIECLENGCLVLKRSGMRGVLMKDGDGVEDKCEDVGHCLGGDVRHWLVVRCRDGGEHSVQEGCNCQLFCRQNSKSGDSLVVLLLARQFVEKVAP